MISNDTTDAALALRVDMTMFASSRNVSELTHNSSTSLLPFKTPIINPHSTAKISPNCTLTEDLAGDVSLTSIHAGSNPPFATHHSEECGESLRIEAGHLPESMQRPRVAIFYTNVIFEIWATKLSYDPDRKFILNGVQQSFHLLPLTP